MIRKLRAVILLVILISLAAGCGITPGPGPQPTLVPTLSLPTNTPSPVYTDTPVNTATPEATATATITPTPLPSPTPTPAVLIGAGDIAYCGEGPEYQGDEKTAALLGRLLEQSPHAAIFTVGDNVYGEGTRAELRNCFGPSWGQYKDRIRPAAGNHDYMTDDAAPYYEYFDEAAGPAGLGYYSYDLGDWHIVVLNSNCNAVACGLDSHQIQWLKADLQSNGKLCTLAYWHHPRWSSGIAGGGSASALWRTAVQQGIDVVVNGHDHDYERFAPRDNSDKESETGTRQFVVGTGGAALRDWGEIKDLSEVRYDHQYGVIQFKLYPGSYEWQFVPVNDGSMTDTGSGTCH